VLREMEGSGAVGEQRRKSASQVKTSAIQFGEVRHEAGHGASFLLHERLRASEQLVI